MTLEKLIQARIPAETAELVESLASSEGVSVSAWLRRTILKEVHPVIIPAWTQDRSLAVNMSTHCFYYLSEVEDLPGTGVKFRVFLGESEGTLRGRPLTAVGASRSGWLEEPDKYWFWLLGSKKPWVIVRSAEGSGQMFVVLRQVEKGAWKKPV